MIHWKFLASLLCIAVLSGACTSSSNSPSQQSTVISVVGTNDLHGAILESRSNGGFDTFAGYVNNLREERAADGGAVLLLDAGDMWQGTLEANMSEGATIVEAYNLLGYDAAAIGNHEFDYGPEGSAPVPRNDGDDPTGALKSRAREADFPLLAANIVDESTGEVISWDNVYPSAHIVKGGISVGVVGAISEFAFLTTHAANTRGLKILPPADVLNREASKLRSEGAKLVIAVVHAGGRCQDFFDPQDLTSCDLGDEIFRIAQDLAPGLVDVIVAGHIHEGIAHEINGIAVIASFSRGDLFGRVDLELDSKSSEVQGKWIFAPTPICEFTNPEGTRCMSRHTGNPAANYAGKPVSRDPEMSQLISRIRAATDEIKQKDLGLTIEADMRRSEQADSILGNLITDILLETTPGADISIINTIGGIRADLNAGPLTFGDVYEVMPFDNQVVTFEATGGQVKKVFENKFQGSGRRGANIGGATVAANCDGGTLELSLIRNDGTQIADSEVLIVSTLDFLASGGGGTFSSITPPHGLDLTIAYPDFRSAIEAWFVRKGKELEGMPFKREPQDRFQFAPDSSTECRTPDGAS